MSRESPTSYAVGVVQELLKLPRATEWVEFKVNNVGPKEIGEYFSALANSAVLAGKHERNLSGV